MYKIILFVAIIFSSCGSIAQNSSPEKLESLIVYGDDFSFIVKEPSHWIGNIDEAEKYYSNIIFYKSKEDFEKGGALIQVLVYNKVDENTIEDLNHDLKKYKSKYPNSIIKELNFDHKTYNCFASLVYLENNFSQYITYINPGVKFKKGLSVSMNISKEEATRSELEAYEYIIKSLLMLK